MMRLQKFLAHCGICSRRKAENLILEGRVAVNGNVVSELGTQVNPERDTVFFDGKHVQPETYYYFIVNKPAGYTCSVDDVHADRLVTDLLSVKARIFPVGRLDRDSEGLLLMTNDGDFAQAVIHPKHKIAKEYEVELDKPIQKKDCETLKTGWNMDGVPVHFDEIKSVKASRKRYHIVIYQGRKRQIRRMFESLGINVVYLKRLRIGALTLGDLPSGKSRKMTQKEISHFI